MAILDSGISATVSITIEYLREVKVLRDRRNKMTHIEKLQAQAEICRKLEKYFTQLAEYHRDREERNKFATDKMYDRGVSTAMYLAANQCRCYYTAAEAEEQGIGIIEWIGNDFELNTNQLGVRHG